MTVPLAHDLSDWVSARRYGVPRWMIERSAAARAGGDWRGACAVSHVDVEFDLARVERKHGTQVAGQLADDLRHLAPDLVRWHLPRGPHGYLTRAAGSVFVLASYGAGAVAGPHLTVGLPPPTQGAQRLRLQFGMLPAAGGGHHDPAGSGYQYWSTSRYLWHTGHTGELLSRIGGGTRPPFLDRAGRPLPAGAVTDPDDRATHTESLAGRYAAAADGPAFVEVFAAAGIAADLAAPAIWPDPRPNDPALWLRALPLEPGRLVAELTRLREIAPHWALPVSWEVDLVFDVRKPARIRAAMHRRSRGTPHKQVNVLPQLTWRRPPDVDLLRSGKLKPHRLHPLVAEALIPDRRWADAGPPPPPAPELVRVRCGGDWHEIHPAGARLLASHTADEERREQAMVSFGGAVAPGCFTVRHHWLTGTGRLPRRLRALRQQLFARMGHGDTPGVMALLEAGVDPFVRDPSQRTLLHLLHLVDHELLLPRLLAAGLPVDARDQHGRTPLHDAVGNEGSPALIRALLDAGAAVNVVDHAGRSVSDGLAGHSRKSELTFLVEEFHRRYRQAANGM